MRQSADEAVAFAIRRTSGVVVVGSRWFATSRRPTRGYAIGPHEGIPGIIAQRVPPGTYEPTAAWRGQTAAPRKRGQGRRLHGAFRVLRGPPAQARPRHAYHGQPPCREAQPARRRAGTVPFWSAYASLKCLYRRRCLGRRSIRRCNRAALVRSSGVSLHPASALCRDRMVDELLVRRPRGAGCRACHAPVMAGGTFSAPKAR